MILWHKVLKSHPCDSSCDSTNTGALSASTTPYDQTEYFLENNAPIHAFNELDYKRSALVFHPSDEDNFP